MPAPARAYYAAGESGGTVPLTVREGRAWLTRKAVGKALPTPALPEHELSGSPEPPALELKELWFRYEKMRRTYSGT